MSQRLIFITGATGVIASHVVSQSLAAGYKVRLSVRKEEQNSVLRKVFSKHAANLDFAVIPDFTSPNRFSKDLEDVTFLDYLNPAVQGTIALLDAAKKVESIKRMVVTSSLFALIPLDGPAAGKFTAKEGANPTIPVDSDMAFPEDPTTNGIMKYHFSKIHAHRATLERVRTKKPSFGLVTLHPSFVFGRNLTQTSAEGLGGTNSMLWGASHSPKPFSPLSAVDVEDVALAHLKALEVETGAGEEVEEFLLSAGSKDHWT